MLEWLRAGAERGYTLGEINSTDESIKFVSPAYDLGAVRVTAVEIDPYPDCGGAQNTGRLVITLPNDPHRRAAVLRWAGRISESHGFDAEGDTGQEHVFITLD